MYQEPPITIDDLAAGDDKDEAAFFVGRKELIASIESTVAGIKNKIKAYNNPETRLQVGKAIASQKTWLIQGAPGAGKSALLTHLQNRWLSRQNGPVVAEVDPNNLGNESLVTRQIADRIIPQHGAKILNAVRTIEASAGIEMVIQAGGKVTDSEQSTDLVLEDLAQLYGEDATAVSKRLFKGNSPKRPKLRPIVVMIDEVQMFEPDGMGLLRKLHNGKHGLPILAVLYGLAYSQERLAAERISRFATSNGRSHVQTLGPLEAGEAAESVRAMLDGYRIKGRDKSDIPDKIGEWSNDWPQHLFHYMAGLATQLKNNLDLTSVNESAVRSFGDRCRVQYYTDRLNNSPIIDCTQLLADVARIIGQNGCTRLKLMSFLRERLWETDPDSESVMPEDMEPIEFIEAMVFAGIVHRLDTTLTIPIPSFRQHLIERGT